MPRLLGFGHGAGGIEGVGEQRIDGIGDLRRPLGIRDAHSEPAHRAFAEIPRLVEVGVVQQEHTGLLLVFRRGVGANQIELPVAAAVLLGPDVALDRNLVAHLPTVLHRHRQRRHGARAGSGKRLQVLRINEVLRVHLEMGDGLHRILGEEVGPILIDAAEPIAMGDGQHAVHPRDLLQGADRQRVDDRVLG